MRSTYVRQVSTTNVREANPNEVLPGCVLPFKAAAIEELFDWSLNFDSGKNPYCIFLDLIGKSEEDFGDNCFFGKFHEVLGYKELCLLGAALKVFEDEGFQQVYHWCDTLEPGLDEDESEDDEYHGDINYGNAFPQGWSWMKK